MSTQESRKVEGMRLLDSFCRFYEASEQSAGKSPEEIAAGIRRIRQNLRESPKMVMCPVDGVVSTQEAMAMMFDGLARKMEEKASADRGHVRAAGGQD